MAIREIEFRGKRIDNGEWVYGFYVKSQEYYTQDVSNAILSADGNHYGFGEYTFETYNEIDESTLGQYTGFVDNNGTKIFEGDIVELYCIRTYCGRQVSQYDKPTKFRAVVKFGQCWNRFGIGFWFDYDNKYNEKICEPIGKEQESRDIWKRAIGEFVPNEYKKETHPNWVWKNYLVVIGNVVDNPELLEG